MFLFMIVSSEPTAIYINTSPLFTCQTPLILQKTTRIEQPGLQVTTRAETGRAELTQEEPS